MFFGRDYEMKAIMRTIQARSFAIVGGRKIGKTSVLTKVQELMEQTSDLSAFYLDCQHLTNYQEFFSSLALKCQVQIGSTSPDELRRVMVRLRRQHGGDVIVLLLDEVDNLLAFDMQQQVHLFRMFRALSQEGLCRFVFCGERRPELSAL
jgi:Cdc6-like AAA superfamily ATPase